MHKIDGPGATPNNEFTEGDPQQGIPATEVTAAMANAWMLELTNFIESRGILLDKQNNTQLLQAIGPAPVGFKNRIINGEFKISQRSTQFQPFDSDIYTVDRWLVSGDESGGTGHVVVQNEVTWQGNSAQIGDLGGASEQNATRTLRIIGQNGGESSIGGPNLEQRCEALEDLAGEEVTFSIYIKADTPADATLEIVQDFGDGSSDMDVVVATKTISVNSLGSGQGYTRYSVSGVCPSVLGKDRGSNPHLKVRYRHSPGVFNQAAGSLRFALGQLERGLSPSAFDYRSETTELDLARRYYEVSQDTNNISSIGSDRGRSYAWLAAGFNAFGMGRRFMVEKRAYPSITWFVSGGTGEIRWGGVDVTVTGSIGTGRSQTGDPIITPTQPAGIGDAHWRADAEL